MNNVSVVIPSLNEEEFIERCLDAVSRQTLGLVKEIIVADNNSTDTTREICRKKDVILVNGGLPAVGRNRGAEEASGEYILFLDADTIIPENFLQSSLTLFEAKSLDVASFFFTPQPLSNWFNVVFGTYNYLAYLASVLQGPFFLTSGCCILTKRSCHINVDGFDENIVVLEEYDYIKKIKKNGNFRVLPVAVKTSTRRFTKTNKWSSVLALFKCYFKWVFKRKIVDDKYGYWKQ
ncbi:MAG: glycosyltransferase [Calditrichaeota bacterium]|nr:MAG: glycosyltransferase [Calditrichota bacterium]MBL1207333.1 glycosyltransferase [Calditrichota bacterium]NOG47166.1 glycosyltransferase [Calditrichota bacterium]